MPEHPAVTFLIDAHQRAEELARDAADGDSGRWFVGRKWNVYREEDQAPWNDVEENRLVVNGNVRSQSDHIALHDPAAALDRIAAEREQLAEHAPDGLHDGRDETECRTCSAPSIGMSGLWPVDWPCRTVLLLAKGWGWTDDRAEEQ